MKARPTMCYIRLVIGASLSEPHTGQTASPAMFIGASLSEPHTCQTASPAIYLCIVRHSVNKCPRVLIHWTASILQCVIQFRKCHHVQIIETASILHLWCNETNGCTFDSHDTTQLDQWHRNRFIVEGADQCARKNFEINYS